MKLEQEFIKEQLDEELGEMRFSKGVEVLERTHPRTWRTRWKALWNKELELPILPVGIGVAIILAVVMINQLGDAQEGIDASITNQKQRQLIEAGGNTYWKDEFEKAVGSVEGDHKG
ncbi:hypothetical protein [Cohnella sp. WQ 127256]|uniref:hypothetical protein n=1 Tax=Cohnella sp. WQ 127256 TaxID=2938790 RepID=UPI0021185700|nr:hypothetical protein [Cohnella sp. WQ 127256]